MNDITHGDSSIKSRLLDFFSQTDAPSAADL